jgi:regulation of enolase protein 1 (concanavalin A-like superfamily)
MVLMLTVPGLPFELAPEGNPPCTHDLRGGALVLRAQAGTDMFVDPAGSANPPDAGRMVGTPPSGDFTLAALVTAELTSTYDAAVLLLHQSERCWAKLCFELSPQGRPTAVTVVTRGTSDDANSFEVGNDGLWLRITRTGSAWAFHASTDGARWQLLRYFSLADHERSDQVKVGFLAQSPTGAGCTAVFDHITFKPGAPEDLRDGS